jgi:hypothetical protein
MARAMAHKHLLLLGSVSLAGKSGIPLYAEVSKVFDSRVTRKTLPRKLGRLLETCSAPDDLEKPVLLQSDALVSIDDVLTLWGCRYVTVLRLMKRGLLHRINFEEEICFDRAELNRLTNRRIAVHPHLTSSKPQIRQGPTC